MMSLMGMIVHCREVVASSASGVMDMCTHPARGMCTASVMFVGGLSVVLLSVVFIIFSVLEVGDGTDSMSYFKRG